MMPGSNSLPAAKRSKRKTLRPRAGKFIPATVARLVADPNELRRRHGRFDYAYFAGSGVTFEVSIRIFQSSPSRITELGWRP
jgi:hypothetical protein